MRPSSVKYAVTFVLLAALSVGLGVYLWSPILTALLAFTAMAFIIVAAAYAFRAPEILGKRPDGRLRLPHRVLLLPYHALSYSSFQLVRLTGSAPPWSEVSPNLFWGRQLTLREAESLTAGHILDLTSEFHECRLLRERDYCSVPMLDGTAPSLDQLERAVDWLRSALRRGTTYVHCAMGHSRSAAVLLAYQIVEGQIESIEDGLTSLQTLRPGAGLTSGQAVVLQQFIRRRLANGACPH